MSIVFQLSSRVPNFIEQSHLETTEGKTIASPQSANMLTRPQHGRRTGHPSSRHLPINVSTLVALCVNKLSPRSNVPFFQTTSPPPNTESGRLSSARS
jgi:hypothetical protein